MYPTCVSSKLCEFILREGITSQWILYQFHFLQVFYNTTISTVPYKRTEILHSEVVGPIKAAIIVFSSESHPKMLISLTCSHLLRSSQTPSFHSHIASEKIMLGRARNSKSFRRCWSRLSFRSVQQNLPNDLFNLLSISVGTYWRFYLGPPHAHGDPAPLGPKKRKLKREELVFYQFISQLVKKSVH